MTQPSLLADHPHAHTLVIEIDDGTLRMDHDYVVTIKTASGDGKPTTLWKERLVGLETDYLDTLVDAAVSAWMYQPGLRELLRALVKTKRLAEQHRRSHDRVRF